MSTRGIQDFTLAWNGKTAKGSGVIRRISPLRATVEAVSLWLGIWIATAPLVLVPVVHLVAVPAGLVGGVALPMLIYRKRRGRLDLTDGACACPACNAPQVVVATDIGSPRPWGRCSSCHCTYTIELDGFIANGENQ